MRKPVDSLIITAVHDPNTYRRFKMKKCTKNKKQKISRNYRTFVSVLYSSDSVVETEGEVLPVDPIY
jgi:hypothetical protein